MTQRDINLIFQQLYCTIGISPSPWEIFVFFFPRESQLRQSRATQPTVHAGCLSVCLIHLTLTRTTGSLSCVCDFFFFFCARICTRPRFIVSSEGHLVGYRVCTELSHSRRTKPSTKRLFSMWRPLLSRTNALAVCCRHLCDLHTAIHINRQKLLSTLCLCDLRR